MSEFKGTPGPWSVNVIGQHWNNPSLTHIEVTFGIEGECVCDTVYRREDANLIAAAPELLKALQDLVREYEGYFEDADESKKLTKSRAAIAKALGETK